MRPADEIVALQKQRELAQGPMFAEMREVGAAFANKIVVPLPELDRNERSSIPNLIQQGITAKAQRVASVVPNLDYPVVRLGIKDSEEKSRFRRMANLGWWENSNMELVLARRARHLLAYTTSPVLVKPDFKLGVPTWEACDALGAFPAPPVRYDDMMRADIIFAYSTTVRQVKADYPVAMGWLLGGKGDEQVSLLEYIDEYERVMLVVGSADASADMAFAGPVRPIITNSGGGGYAGRSVSFIQELDRAENRAGVCWAVVPGTVSLDKPVLRYHAMIGTHMASAKLQALELVGIQSGILPKTYFVQSENQGGILVEATVGRLGHVKGGKLETVHVEPSMRPDAAQDRMERTQRIDGGIPVATSGESQTGVRTGRLGDSLLSAAIDPDIAECQKILQRSMQYENEVAVAQAVGYAPNRPVSFHINWKGSRGPVTYKAADLFKDHAPSTVTYPIVGADEQALVVGGGQRLGLGTMSKYEFMRLDPMVKDAEWSHDQIIAEGIEQAMLQGLQQQAVAGALSHRDLANISREVRSNRMELDEAIIKIDDEVKARQATSGAPGTPEAPAAPGSPEAQPGLAAGTPAAAGAGAAIQPAGPSEANLMGLLQQARMVRQQQRAS